MQPGTTSKASTAFSLENGETVEINCTFSPQKADVDFGLIAPNGLFYHAAGNDGTFTAIPIKNANIQSHETMQRYQIKKLDCKLWE